MNDNFCRSRRLTRVAESQHRAELGSLADELIAELARLSPDIREGTVMTLGPAPYRRLDCDRRALAYVRARPRKGLVRIDISGLWVLPRESPLAGAGSGASLTLVLRSRADKTEAIAFLLATVETTRAQHARAQAREEMRRARERELREMFPQHHGIPTGPLGPGTLIAAEGPPRRAGA